MSTPAPRESARTTPRTVGLGRVNSLETSVVTSAGRSGPRHDGRVLGSASHPIAAALAAVIAAMAATVAVTPEFRERGGTDVILDAPHLALPVRVTLLAISAATAVAIFRSLPSRSANSATRRVTIEVIAVSVAVGVLAGLGYRLVTAKSAGANIGGGLVLLASPIGALVFVGYLGVRLRAMRESGP